MAQTSRPADAVADAVRRIAAGDDVESAAATDELVELLIDPLAQQLGDLERRPFAERVRLHHALLRFSAAMRLRLFRATLPAAEQKLLDEFRRHYDELTLRLFDERLDVRLAAVEQIPLEPNSGAGVLIAAKVNDPDGEVANAALRLASELKDAVVARGLIRYVRLANETVRSGYFKATDTDTLTVLGEIVAHSIRALAAGGSEDAAPTVVEAARLFSRSPLWQQAGTLGDVAHALGRLGDSRAIPYLVELLGDEKSIRSRAVGNGPRATQTVGDAALAALLRLTDQTPAEYGMVTAENAPEFAGFTSDSDRQAAYARIRAWLAQRGHGAASRPSAP